jgi:hypothetical protein
MLHTSHDTMVGGVRGALTVVEGDQQKGTGAHEFEDGDVLKGRS